MSITSEIFTSDGSNFSHYLLDNGTVLETGCKTTLILDFINIMWGLPINSYVIWLIVTGTGNGLAAEFFSLNLAVCEMLFCIESVMLFLSSKFNILWMAVFFLDGFPATGRPLFHCLICVERYLAVVHPVTFLKFKPFRYRVICTVFVWVATLVSCVCNIIIVLLFLTALHLIFFSIQFFLFLSFQLFFCLAVLRALKQSGPGEKGREEENNIKRRAFYLILITNVTMVIFYAPFLILFLINKLSMQAHNIFLSVSYAFFTLAGVVQPLLFLYRVGKLPFIKY